jgi:predicted transglutaminase-like cysteine proteinase
MVATLGATPSANASLSGPTRGLKSAVERLRFERPALPPMAFTMYCLRYPAQCKPRGMLFRGGLVHLTEARRSELMQVNLAVNGRIRPQRNEGGVATEEWLINPETGDCNDYAVTKRHDLIAKGWPPRALLLSEVKLASGEHHLILVVRTQEGDVVLDNMTDSLRAWNRTPYRWVRMQTPADPSMWSTVAQGRGKRAVERVSDAMASPTRIKRS